MSAAVNNPGAADGGAWLSGSRGRTRTSVSATCGSTGWLPPAVGTGPATVEGEGSTRRPGEGRPVGDGAARDGSQAAASGDRRGCGAGRRGAGAGVADDRGAEGRGAEDRVADDGVGEVRDLGTGRAEGDRSPAASRRRGTGHGRTPDAVRGDDCARARHQLRLGRADHVFAPATSMTIAATRADTSSPATSRPTSARSAATATSPAATILDAAAREDSSAQDQGAASGHSGLVVIPAPASWSARPAPPATGNGRAARR